MTSDKVNSFFIGVFVTLIIVLVIVMSTDLKTRYWWERKAVEVGAASWVLDDGGSRILEWKTCEEAKP